MDGDAVSESENVSSQGSYVLRDLIKDIPLGTTDDEGSPAHITCVDTWNGNLYIGTSAAEVLHYVAIPPDPSDATQAPSYIFASKLEPSFTTQQDGRDAGVKQILLLPNAGKAAILCDGTVTFYSLPELSPAYGAKVQQTNSLRVGGIDLNLDADGQDSSGGSVITICTKQKLRVIKIGREARKVRDIDLPDVTAIQRRGDLVCVADGNSYSLLDVLNQRKNDLFPISSYTEPVPQEPPQLPSSASAGGHARSFSAVSPVRRGPVHERNVSLGADPRSTSPWPTRSSSQQPTSPGRPASREQSPEKPVDSSTMESAPPEQTPQPLHPNIVSPTANEFLLTTGTRLSEPGVGIIINLDGDPSGGTIEFSSYPESLVLDGVISSSGPTSPGPGAAEGYVLAIVRRSIDGEVQKGIEVQTWNADASTAQSTKDWLPLASYPESSQERNDVVYCLRTATSAAKLDMPGIRNSLRLRRLTLSKLVNETDAKRELEEDALASRFAHVNTDVLLFCNDTIQWVTRNPLILRLERQLDAAVIRNDTNGLLINVTAVQKVINSIRGQEALDELEFFTLTYIRQKASLLLFGNVLLQSAAQLPHHPQDLLLTKGALVDGDIDPRVLLSLLATLQKEVREGEQGLWISQGLRDTVLSLLEKSGAAFSESGSDAMSDESLLALVKQYLQVWTKKKGFGSVEDEKNVFQSIDAALLHILLVLDQSSPRGPALPGSIRAELNELVDRGLDCYERAVELLERFDRLYMLSRLYQKQRMPARVLETWTRILKGARDAGGELIDGEHDIRKYLTRIHDQALVQEYGAWLAARNPKLGAQVFADEKSHVTFQPSEAVAILKAKAPGAVKDYLEHLVFDKNHVQYVNDLIAFYLDSVLAELQSSEGTKSTLLQSYETYRALRPPKPTYRQFVIDNVIDAEWWRNRLRLLQLIGGSHGAASQYDVHALRERLAPYSNELVPEMVILNGREGQHEEALRLLTHGLGDYDTAVRYCLLGGSSIFHPTSKTTSQLSVPSKEEQARLFGYLLHEFFQIEDLSERLERTAELLERFGGWFDVARVLELLPGGWSVELVSGFLIHALRRLVRERNETVVVKALSSAQNLRKNVEFIEKTEGIAPTVVPSETAIDVG